METIADFSVVSVVPRPRHFVVTGIQRTGTTLVRTTLDSHPDILCAGETFQTGFEPLRGKFRLFGPYRMTGNGFFVYSAASLPRQLRSVLAKPGLIDEYLDHFYAGHCAVRVCRVDGDSGMVGMKKGSGGPVRASVEVCYVS